MTFTYRARHKAPAKKCKQCNVEVIDAARSDGLGRSCGEIIDRQRKNAAAHAESLKKASK